MNDTEFAIAALVTLVVALWIAAEVTSPLRVAFGCGGVVVPAAFIYFMPAFSTPLAQLTLGQMLGCVVWVLLVIPAILWSIASIRVAFTDPSAPVLARRNRLPCDDDDL
jgi:hypothetical protein